MSIAVATPPHADAVTRQGPGPRRGIKHGPANDLTSDCTQIGMSGAEAIVLDEGRETTCLPAARRAKLSSGPAVSVFSQIGGRGLAAPTVLFNFVRDLISLTDIA